jgi:ferredoxin
MMQSCERSGAFKILKYQEASMLLYFTATGNSLLVASKIGGELISMPNAIRESRHEFSDDKIGLIFPVFWVSVPPYVAEFIKKAKLSSNYIFAVMTYGNYDGGASHHLMKIAQQCGISFTYVNTIKMVDNYLPGFDIKEQMAAEQKKGIDQCLNAIVEDLQASKQYIQKRSAFHTFITNMCAKSPQGRSYGLCKTFYEKGECIGCKTCEKVCPLHNVHVFEQGPGFGENCMGCLACVHNCPQAAIHVRGEKSNARFRNQHISLDQIISANNAGNEELHE